MENQSRVVRRKSSAITVAVSRKPVRLSTHVEALSMIGLLCRTGAPIDPETIVDILRSTEDFGSNPPPAHKPQALTPQRRKIFAGQSNREDGVPVAPSAIPKTRAPVVPCFISVALEPDPLTLDRVAKVTYEFRIPELPSDFSDADSSFGSARMCNELVDAVVRHAAVPIEEAAKKRGVTINYTKPTFRSKYIVTTDDGL